jgi:tetratricopeptide (TPR) repeat protein
MKRIILFFLKRFALNAFIGEDFEKSLKYFERMYSLDPGEPGILYNIALAYLGLADYEKSEQYLLDHVQQEGETREAVRALGDLYYLWGKKEKSLRYYQNYTRMLPDGGYEKMIELRISLLGSLKDADTLVRNHEKFKRSMQAFRLKHYDKAEMLLREVIMFDPSNVHAYNNLGVIMKEHHEDWKEAAELFSHAAMLSSCHMYKSNLKKIELEMRE